MKKISGELLKLKKGNERYTQEKFSIKNFKEIRKETEKGQKPYVIIVACSDSRVVPRYRLCKGFIKKKKLRILGAKYKLLTGVVEFIKI